MSDKLNLKQYIRNINDFPISGIKFRDITSLIETPKQFKKTCKELTRVTEGFLADIIVSIESRGFIFAGSVANDLLLPFVLARKPGKLPNDTFTKNFELEYGSTSIEIQKNTNIKKGQRVSDKQRTTSKSAMRTNTYRLLRKAEANVTAVLEGTFGRAK